MNERTKRYEAALKTVSRGAYFESPLCRRADAMRNRIPLNQKRLFVDFVHEDEWELNGFAS